jgi:hypothetical protein
MDSGFFFPRPLVKRHEVTQYDSVDTGFKMWKYFFKVTPDGKSVPLNDFRSTIMKKVFFVTVIFLFGHFIVWANPLAGVQGVVSYSEELTVYFDSEANAVRWLEAQTDFMSQGEVSAAQRRLMETVMTSIVPNFSDLVRMHSDFCVLVVRSTNPGESSLHLYVRGVLTRLWQY